MIGTGSSSKKLESRIRRYRKYLHGLMQLFGHTEDVQTLLRDVPARDYSPAIQKEILNEVDYWEMVDAWRKRGVSLDLCGTMTRFIRIMNELKTRFPDKFKKKCLVKGIQKDSRQQTTQMDSHRSLSSASSSLAMTPQPNPSPYPLFTANQWTVMHSFVLFFCAWTGQIDPSKTSSRDWRKTIRPEHGPDLVNLCRLSSNTPLREMNGLNLNLVYRKNLENEQIWSFLSKRTPESSQMGKGGGIDGRTLIEFGRDVVESLILTCIEEDRKEDTVSLRECLENDLRMVSFGDKRKGMKGGDEEDDDDSSGSSNDVSSDTPMENEMEEESVHRHGRRDGAMGTGMASATASFNGVGESHSHHHHHHRSPPSRRHQGRPDHSSRQPVARRTAQTSATTTKTTTTGVSPFGSSSQMMNGMVPSSQQIGGGMGTNSSANVNPFAWNGSDSDEESMTEGIGGGGGGMDTGGMHHHHPGMDGDDCVDEDSDQGTRDEEDEKQSHESGPYSTNSMMTGHHHHHHGPIDESAAAAVEESGMNQKESRDKPPVGGSMNPSGGGDLQAWGGHDSGHQMNASSVQSSNTETVQIQQCLWYRCSLKLGYPVWIPYSPEKSSQFHTMYDQGEAQLHHTVQNGANSTQYLVQFNRESSGVDKRYATQKEMKKVDTDTTMVSVAKMNPKEINGYPVLGGK